MNLQKYEDMLHIALSHYNVGLLVKLWHDSMVLSKTSLAQINRQILELLPRFEKYYDLEPSTDMKGFVKKYYNSLCDEGPDFCVGYYAAQGDLKRVKQQVEKGAVNLAYAMEQAAANVRENVVHFLMGIGCKKYTRGLEGTLNGLSKTDTEELREARRRLVYFYMARKGTEGTGNGLIKSLMVNDRELIVFFKEYFSEIGLTKHDYKHRYVYSAAFGGNKDFIEEILNYYTDDEEERLYILDRASEGAYDGGNEELEAWAIELGGKPSSTKDTVLEAIKKEDLELIKSYIEKGVNGIADLYEKVIDTKNLDLIRLWSEHFDPFPSSLRKAGQLGDMRIIQILTEETEEKQWTNILEGAASSGRLSIIRYCLNKGAKITELAFIEAAAHGFKDVVEYFLERQKFDLEPIEGAIIVAEEQGDSTMEDYLFEVAEKLYPEEFQQ